MHVSPSGPVKPTLQAHDVNNVLPASETEFDGHGEHVKAPTASEYLPASQLLHAAAPVTALYLPASHCVHVPPSGPENPTLQPHDVTVALPAAELELDGHEEHVASSEAPTPSEYLPASQLLHASDPATTLKVPAAHSVHVSPLGPEYPYACSDCGQSKYSVVVGATADSTCLACPTDSDAPPW